MDIATQTEFAAFYGVSQPMIHKYIQQGKIPKSCIMKDGKYKKIVVDCAIEALAGNLSPTKRRSKPEPERDIQPESDILPELSSRERVIQFQPESREELANRLSLVIDMMSHLNTFFDDEIQALIDPILDELAGIFDSELVEVDGLPGRRCVALPD
ncbi:hypothetical protein [Desulfobacter postgatei]|jgi:hypothetical protein|uniref:hypothetical protein n=1 Tax=Desulfobacter postgatei TaxID=2293 RepID=UPI002A36BB4E|nr:hypothetical protein [Desulfobacter postgatei]MDX9963958.1 hypothetical protein [Desulfobacter postgatei]